MTVEFNQWYRELRRTMLATLPKFGAFNLLRSEP
jgi:hypothetical protein